MSNGNTAIPVSPVNDMIGALGAALASHARVPELEARIADLETTLDNSQRHNQGLETNIVGYKQTIADLLSKVRSLEVERDDASFRVLETEDKLATLLAACRSIGSALGNAIDRADPPKAEQVAVPVSVEGNAFSASAGTGSTGAGAASVGSVAPQAADKVGESAADPTIGSTLAASPESAVGPSDKGQSAADPTASSQANTDTNPSPTSQTAPMKPASQQGSVSHDEAPSSEGDKPRDAAGEWWNNPSPHAG